MKHTTIYALADPFSGEIRYVGKTVKPLRSRVRAHINRAPHSLHLKSAQWLEALAFAGVEPQVLVLEEVEAHWQAVERFWIASFRAVGVSAAEHD